MRNAHRYGPWALITGASDGIGQAMAPHIAAEGINVVLIARNSGQAARPRRRTERRAQRRDEGAADRPVGHGAAADTIAAPHVRSRHRVWWCWPPDSAPPEQFSRLHLSEELQLIAVNIVAVMPSFAHLRRQARCPRHGRNRAVRIHRRLAGCARAGQLRRVQGLRAEPGRGAPRRTGAARGRRARRRAWPRRLGVRRTGGPDDDVRPPPPRSSRRPRSMRSDARTVIPGARAKFLTVDLDAAAASHP